MFNLGWCSKILENVDKSFKEDADLGTATQRDCLQRAPSDGQVIVEGQMLNTVCGPDCM
jgi:hypothetical protein